MNNQKVILIISSNKKWLIRTLNSLGNYEHIFLYAYNGRKGLEVARIDRPDLIICAEKLPNRRVSDLHRLIRSDAELSGIPFYSVGENEGEIASIIKSLRRKKIVCPGSRDSLDYSTTRKKCAAKAEHFEYYLEFSNRFFAFGPPD